MAYDEKTGVVHPRWWRRSIRGGRASRTEPARDAWPRLRSGVPRDAGWRSARVQGVERSDFPQTRRLEWRGDPRRALARWLDPLEAPLRGAGGEAHYRRVPHRVSLLGNGGMEGRRVRVARRFPGGAP